MNARQFAEAMSKLDDRYVAEALFYKRPYQMVERRNASEFSIYR